MGKGFPLSNTPSSWEPSSSSGLPSCGAQVGLSAVQQMLPAG